MTVQRWPPRLPPDELGVVVHDAIVLAGSAGRGVIAGLRCVFAHPTGVHLPVVLVASGIYAEAAGRRTRPAVRDESAGAGSDPCRPLQLTVEVNDQCRVAQPYQAQSSGGADRYDLQADYWIPELPRDGRIRVTASWPEIGLPEHSTLLTCEHLDDLAGRVHPLR